MDTTILKRGISFLLFCLCLQCCKSQYRGVTDLKNRESILQFVENLRTSYIRKDLDFLKKMYSDDAQIPKNEINRQVRENLTKVTPDEKLVYAKYFKADYLSKMQQIFATKDSINMKFDELKVVQHNKNPNYYAITFKQQWSTTKYTDENYVFFLIDFRKHDAPEILISTLQPRFVNGKEIDKRELFNITSFGQLQ